MYFMTILFLGYFEYLRLFVSATYEVFQMHWK